MSDKRILFVAQEIAPYLPSTMLSELGNHIPQGMQERGFEVRTFMPKYGTINERRNQLHEVIRLSGMNLTIDDVDHPLIIKVASLLPSRIQVYFIDNDDYFQRSPDDVDPVGSNRVDNDERAIFFSLGTIETVKKLRWEPGIVHCQGWITGLIPLYLRSVYAGDPAFKDSKIIYSLLPGQFQGTLDGRLSEKLILNGMNPKEEKKIISGEIDTNTLHRLAMLYADGIIIADENPDSTLLEFVASRGVPVLDYEKTLEGPDAYAEFYKSFR